MGRAPCCDKNGLKKGPWTPEEDQKLIDYIQKNGYGNWRTLPKNAGLQRCGKSCRLRWTNYLRPDIKRGRFSFEEEETIIQLHSILGNKWSAIAGRLPGRTDNEIKNYWNTHIRKRLLRMGIDPVTHSPRLDLLDLSSILTSNLYNNGSSCSQMSNMSRLMGMQSSTSSMINPELLRIANSIMSQPQNNNDDGNFYVQNQLDPTQLIHDQFQNDQSQLIQALQQQAIANYNSNQYFNNVVTEPNLSDDQDYVPVPFTGFYGYDSEQNIVSTGAEPKSASGSFQFSNGQNLSMNSVISTPSSSPSRIDNTNFYSSNYVNGSCTSTEDERDNSNDIPHCGNLMMMKCEFPEIFDVNEFIY